MGVGPSTSRQDLPPATPGMGVAAGGVVQCTVEMRKQRDQNGTRLKHAHKFDKEEALSYAITYIYIHMWQAHLETANYSRSEVLLRKPLKIADIFPFTIELP